MRFSLWQAIEYRGLNTVSTPPTTYIYRDTQMKNIRTHLEMLAIIGACTLAWSSLSGCSNNSNEAADTEAAHSHDEGEDHDGHDHGSSDDDSGADVNMQSDADMGDDVSPNDSSVASGDVYPGLLGEITAIPVAGDPSSSLKIHHVQIPDFKTKDGTVHVNAKGVSGMSSMTMPFPVGEGVDLSGLAVGDKIKFTFMVDWSGQSKNAWEVTKIEKMPADTAIDYSNAATAGDAPADEAP